MRASIDFRWVKQQVPPERAFDLLEMTLRRQGKTQWRGQCPACQADKTFVYTDGEGFICHHCDGYGGDQIALAKFVCDLPGMYEGALELATLAGIPLKPENGTVRTSRGTSTRTSTASPVPESERVRKPRSSRGEGRHPSPQPSRTEFDPVAFAAKLQYTDEVAELNISEEDAAELGIGFYRGKLYQALRYDNGQTAGYSWLDKEGIVHLPPALVPKTNVVPLRKRA